MCVPDENFRRWHSASLRSFESRFHRTKSVHCRLTYLLATILTAHRTFFQADEWPVMDSAEPRNGWSYSEIKQTLSGAAVNDSFGKLYFMLDHLIPSFHRRLRGTKIESRLFNVDAATLPEILEHNRFARIEVCETIFFVNEYTNAVGLRYPTFLTLDT